MKLEQGYVLQVCVILFTGGEYLTRYTPQDQVQPPWPGTPPWDQVHPLDQVHIPKDQVHPLGPGTPSPRPGTPPGPGTPPRTRYTLPWDQVHPPDQVHPSGPGTPHPGPGTPRAQHAGRYGLLAGGRHPTGMQSCRVRSCTFIWCYPMKM